MRGLIRQHQFDKVELVKFTTPEQSYDELEALTANAEEVLKRLELPYRTMRALHRRHGLRVGQDLRHRGVAAEPEDLPRDLVVLATARRSRRGAPTSSSGRSGTGKAEFVHTLNGSGLAVGRTLIAMLENYQQKDGSVVIPAALRPFMGGREVIAAR